MKTDTVVCLDDFAPRLFEILLELLCNNSFE